MKHFEKLIEKHFSSTIKLSPLIDFKIFQVNERYFELPKKNQWIIDGGIELQFPSAVFCLGWSLDYDSFIFKNKKFEEIYTENNFIELNGGNINKLKKMIKNTIVEAKYKWIDYDVILDYTMATKKESRLVELIIKFKSNDIVQFSIVDYHLEENSSPKNFSYDINGELLIALNNNEIIKNNNT